MHSVSEAVKTVLTQPDYSSIQQMWFVRTKMGEKDKIIFDIVEETPLSCLYGA